MTQGKLRETRLTSRCTLALDIGLALKAEMSRRTHLPQTLVTVRVLLGAVGSTTIESPPAKVKHMIKLRLCETTLGTLSSPTPRFRSLVVLPYCYRVQCLWTVPTCLVGRGLTFLKGHLNFKLRHPKIFTARQGNYLTPCIMSQGPRHLISLLNNSLLLARLGIMIR